MPDVPTTVEEIEIFIKQQKMAVLDDLQKRTVTAYENTVIQPWLKAAAEEKSSSRKNE